MSAVSQGYLKIQELDITSSNVVFDENLENETLLIQVEKTEEKLIRAIWDNHHNQKSLYKELTRLISDNQDKIQNCRELQDKCKEIADWLKCSFPTST